MSERYSIEVEDNFVTIYGHLSIEEAFDFLNFFDKKGFKSIVHGQENSTLAISKTSASKTEENIKKNEHESSEKFHENLYDKEKKSHEKTKSRVLELESLVKSIISDKSERLKNLEKQSEILLNFKRKHLQSLESNPEIEKEIKDFLHGFDLDKNYETPENFVNPKYTTLVGGYESITSLLSETHREKENE